MIDDNDYSIEIDAELYDSDIDEIDLFAERTVDESSNEYDYIQYE